MIRRGRAPLVCLTVGLWVLPTAPAAAQAPAIAEEEVYVFLDRVFDTLKVCDADQFARYCDASATAHFTYSTLTPEILPLGEYLRRMRKHCQPYSTYDWDRPNWSVAVSGQRAVARATIDWGGKDRQTGVIGDSKVSIKQQITMARRGQGLVVVRLEEHVRQLRPGGEKAYLDQYYDTSMLGGAITWYNGAIEFMKALWAKGDRRKRP
jgi:hypothetical protein